MAEQSDPLLNRRELLRLGALGAGGLAVSSLVAPAAGAATGQASMIERGSTPLDLVRIGFVGVGLQGTSHVKNFLRIDGVELSVRSIASGSMPLPVPDFTRGGWGRARPLHVMEVEAAG